MIRAIVGMTKEWLKKNGHAGLYNHDKECSCTIDDLLCCDEYLNRCVAAEKVSCDCKLKCDFHLKPADEETAIH